MNIEPLILKVSHSTIDQTEPINNPDTAIFVNGMKDIPIGKIYSQSPKPTGHLMINSIYLTQW